jgi:hypothetical protein
MPLTREDVRAAVERAGDAHWQALIRHHEDPYPRPTPTPGDICRAEAERLTRLDLADRPDLALDESRVTRIGEEVELVHLFRRADGSDLRTDPFRNYAPDPPAAD